MPEFLIYGQKRKVEVYFEQFMSLKVVDKLVFLHKIYNYNVNKQILQSVNILVLNMNDKSKLRKLILSTFFSLNLFYNLVSLLKTRLLPELISGHTRTCQSIKAMDDRPRAMTESFVDPSLLK